MQGDGKVMMAKHGFFAMLSGEGLMFVDDSPLK